jgi:hypothetical protein
MTGQDKIPLLLAEKGQELLNQLIPKIIDIATQTGIQNIGELKEKLPDFCLPPDELKKILTIRNALVDKLNSASQTINQLKKIVDPLNTVVTVTSTVVNTINTVSTITKASIPLIPTPPPGSPDPGKALLVSLDSLNKVLAKTTPKITKAQNTISSIATTVTFVNTILLKIIGLLNSIDKYLKGCNAISTTSDTSDTSNTLTPLDSSLTQLEQEQAAALAQSEIPSSLTNYQGFILEVITEVYSPTVNRVKAVAKNAQGIILLQTPLSFTTTPQVLIEEIKLIIDSNNLKAN